MGYFTMNIDNRSLLAFLLVAGASLCADEPFTVSRAIQKAWTDQAGLKAGQAMVESRQAEADGYRDLRLPTLTLIRICCLLLTRTQETLILSFSTL